MGDATSYRSPIPQSQPKAVVRCGVLSADGSPCVRDLGHYPHERHWDGDARYWPLDTTSGPRKKWHCASGCMAMVGSKGESCQDCESDAALDRRYAPDGTLPPTPISELRAADSETGLTVSGALEDVLDDLERLAKREGLGWQTRAEVWSLFRECAKVLGRVEEREGEA